MPIHVAILTDDLEDTTIGGASSENAKTILFNTKPDFSILNRDDANYRIFAEYPSKTATFTYGSDRDADLRVRPGRIYKHGAEASLMLNSERFEVATYVTDPNASYYMAAAATAAFALGFNSDAIIDGIADYEPKPSQESLDK